MSEDQSPNHADHPVQPEDQASFEAARRLVDVTTNPAIEAYHASEWEELTTYDMVQIKQARDDAEHRASHDQLTGLLNRAGLLEKMDSLLGDAKTGDIGVLFIDLDKFKQINDKMSHRRGDDFLQQFSAWLSGFVRQDNGEEGDVIARVGGDEFVVLVKFHKEASEARTEVDPTETLDGFADRLENGFNGFLIKHPGYRRIGVGLSIGGSIWEEGMAMSELIDVADREMYQNKAGKKTVDER